MDPCPFVRLVIGSLALRASSNIPLPSSCYCKIKLKGLPTQIADVTYCSADITDQVQACFTFNKSEFHKVIEKSKCLKIQVYSGRKGNPICGLGSGKLLGVVLVALELKDGNNNNTYQCVVLKNGWVEMKPAAVQLHLNVWVEPDPRFVFEFEGEPECSPQVFQVNGNVRQAVFTCKFGLRNELGLGKKEKERKGWSVTIHDLSGSPVAMASMVTPFVPSQGSDVVKKSNPGGWLILRPGDNTWKPWGRLEAWRESAKGAEIVYRFELLPEAGLVEPMTLSSCSVISKHGGKFIIDINGNNNNNMMSTGSPMTTPSGSFDSGSGSDIWSGSWANIVYQGVGGFVMSSKVRGGGCRKPEVEIGVQHVTCTEDAAAFVALAAAVDLSVDACQPFSRKLRKELRHDGDS